MAPAPTGLPMTDRSIPAASLRSIIPSTSSRLGGIGNRAPASGGLRWAWTSTITAGPVPSPARDPATAGVRPADGVDDLLGPPAVHEGRVGLVLLAGDVGDERRGQAVPHAGALGLERLHIAATGLGALPRDGQLGGLPRPHERQAAGAGPHERP